MSGCGVLSYGTCNGSHGLHFHKEASEVELSVDGDRTLRYKYVLIFPAQPSQANSCAIDRQAPSARIGIGSTVLRILRAQHPL